MNITLKTIPLDIVGTTLTRPVIPASEYEARADALYEAVGADWVIVYGDREHAANIAFVCGFDPRFEEAALALGPHGRRILIVGNEGLGYTGSSKLPVDVVLCQSFSLMGQPRATAPRLTDALRNIGLAPGASVGLLGWKYLEAEECDDPALPAFAPAFLVDAIRTVITPAGRVHDATAALMHPTRGLKSHNGAAQIAAFEWTAMRAATGVLRVVRGARPGMSEYDAAKLMGYEGDPLSCHVMLASANADAPVIGLCSPSSRILTWGDGISTAIGLQGSLCARAGLLRDTADESFVESYVSPYFCAIATWWQTMRIGVTGGEVLAEVINALSDAPFKPLLNPGHLTSLDEWTHTPVRPDSQEAIASGMVFQCDIIPAPMPNGQALNCEDTVAIADEALRAQMRTQFPDAWQRIERRRTFMREALGIALAEELLPLSDTCAYLPPFWMASEFICTHDR